jgi:hypothetical protein
LFHHYSEIEMILCVYFYSFSGNKTVALWFFPHWKPKYTNSSNLLHGWHYKIFSHPSDGNAAIAVRGNPSNRSASTRLIDISKLNTERKFMHRTVNTNCVARPVASSPSLASKIHPRAGAFLDVGLPHSRGILDCLIFQLWNNFIFLTRRQN